MLPMTGLYGTKQPLGMPNSSLELEADFGQLHPHLLMPQKGLFSRLITLGNEGISWKLECHGSDGISGQDWGARTGRELGGITAQPLHMGWEDVGVGRYDNPPFPKKLLLPSIITLKRWRARLRPCLGSPRCRRETAQSIGQEKSCRDKKRGRGSGDGRCQHHPPHRPPPEA